MALRNGLTLQEYVNFLQSQIDEEKIDGSLPVAVRLYENPKQDWWLLGSDTTIVEQHDDLAVITY